MHKRSAIRRLAAELLEEAEVARAPVPVDKVARRQGFRLYYERLETDLSGFYVRNGDDRVIGVNGHHPSVRQRFTIAHELGHALLEGTAHHDRVFRFRDPRSSEGIDPEEVAANTFAAELLMPEEWITDRWTGLTSDGELTDEEAAKQMAKEFGVSSQALTIRLSTLGLAWL
jgi:Zn-dependent peptidase ImmA (M78 family)